MLGAFKIIPTDPRDDLSAEDELTLLDNAATLVLAGQEAGVEPGEAVGLSQDYFDGVHELAARYYAGKRFEDASLLFRRLLQLKPSELSYIKGLGACQLGLENYEGAVKMYSMAYAFDAMDPECSYYLGLSQYFMKDYELAFDNLRFARVLDEEKPKPGSQIAAWASQLLERIKTLVPAEQAALIDKRG